MNTSIYQHMMALSFGSVLFATSHAALSGTLTIDCSQGRVFIGYGVNDVETCLGRRDIELNGEKTTEAFTLTESGNRLIPLQPGDTAVVRARMDCATAEDDVFGFEEDDVETVVVESHTISGCQQDQPDLAPALLPEWNEELGITDADRATSDTETDRSDTIDTEDPVTVEQESTDTSDETPTTRVSLFNRCAGTDFRIPGESFTTCIRRLLFTGS